MKTNQFIKHTQAWIDEVVIGFNLCPFAFKAKTEHKIRYQVVDTNDLEAVLTKLLQECQYLDEKGEIETTILILANGFNNFDDYLELLDLADALLYDQQYEGVYQLASFHPQYIFANSLMDDAANYTNRSPYPILHLLREESISKVLQHYINPEQIPERNIEYTRNKGIQAMQAILNKILTS